MATKRMSKTEVARRVAATKKSLIKAAEKEVLEAALEWATLNYRMQTDEDADVDELDAETNDAHDRMEEAAEALRVAHAYE